MERGTDNVVSVEPSIRFAPDTGAAIIDLGPAPNPLPSLQLTIRDVATGRYLTPDGWRKRATFLEAVTVATEPRLLLAIDAAITAHISTSQEVTIEELALGKRQRLAWPAPVIPAVAPAPEPPSPENAPPDGFALSSWDEEKQEAEERPATTTIAVETEASNPSTSPAREIDARSRASRPLIAASIVAILIGSGAAFYGIKKYSDAVTLIANSGSELTLLVQERQTLDKQRSAVERDQTAIADERRKFAAFEKEQQQLISNELLKAQSISKGALAAVEAERRRLAVDRQNAGPEIARIEEVRRSLSLLEDKLKSEKNDLKELKSNIDIEKIQIENQKNDISAKMEELSRKRNEIISEWNAVLNEAPANIFHAVSVDKNGGVWWSVRKNSARTARQDVEQRCNAESTIGSCNTLNFTNECVAIAWSVPNGGWGRGTGASRQQAGIQAVRACQNANNPGCHVTPDRSWCPKE